jgi:hypothetical protein
MSSPIKISETVPSTDYKYRYLQADLVERLVSVYRIMFPHHGVPNEFYEHVVQKLDEKAAHDRDLPRFLGEGIEALFGQQGSSWISEGARLQALKGVEQTPFFQTLRSHFVVHFYSNPAIWPRFGYEGSSNDQGGYLHRGFNDIDWIKKEEL